jgi:repressor LexA
MKPALTKKQKAVLDFIQQHIRSQGYPPTLREIAAHFKFRAVGTVQGYIRALTAKGYLTHDPDHARTLSVNEYPGDPLHIPILGAVAAGQPVFSPENFDGTLPCGMLVSDPGRTFALQIQGESMIDAGILDRDFVLVQTQVYYNNGDIVVARIDNEVTCKRFFREGNNTVRLVPENPAMEPMVFSSPTSFDVLGKVIGVYRRLG